MKFFIIKDFCSKCDQIHSLLKKSLMENFIFCAVLVFLYHLEFDILSSMFKNCIYRLINFNYFVYAVLCAILCKTLKGYFLFPLSF